VDEKKDSVNEKRYNQTSSAVLLLLFFIFEGISLIFTVFLLFLAWPLNNILEKTENFEQIFLSLGASVLMHLIPIFLVISMRLFDKANSKEMGILVGITVLTMFWSICLGWNSL